MDTDYSASRTRQEAVDKIYQPLILQTRDIRLVHLQPGNGSDTIRCTLEIISLDQVEEDEYQPWEALSYVWGLPEKCHDIDVDGYSLQITANLFAALRGLRFERSPRTLWIDAICINQTDQAERNSQVQLMGKIYGRSSSTTAWLEDPSPDLQIMRAFGLLQKLAALGMAHEQDLHLDASLSPNIYELVACSLDDLLSLRHLVKHEYWSRVWTLQECILPTVLHITCGQYSISLDELCTGVRLVQSHEFRCCRLVHLPGHLDMQRTFLDICGKETMSIVALHTLRSNSASTLYKLALTSGRANATDARDYVYGLLGLLGRIDMPVHIDVKYQLTVQDVFQEATAACVRAEGCLRILIGCSLGSRGHLRLPSWVYNWNTKSSSPSSYYNILDLPGIYNVVPNKQVNFRVAGAIATLRGFLISRIQRTRNVSPQLDTAFESSVIHILNELAHASQLDFEFSRPMFRHVSLTPDAFLDTSSRPRSVSRLIVTLFDGLTVKTVDPSSLEHYTCQGLRAEENETWHLQRTTERRAWSDLTMSVNMWLGDAHHAQLIDWEVANLLRANLYTHTFLLAEDGRIGNAQGTAEVGDWIAVLYGMDVPCVLREMERDPGHPERTMYQYVGATYVDGMMDGEAIAGLEQGRFHEQDIHLC